MPTAAATNAVSIDSARLDQLINERFAASAGPGLAVAVVRDGGLAYTWSSGYADTARQTPITLDTRFRIGSISKTFTAVGVMQLRDEGHFDLDDPVNQHVKRIRINSPGRPITIRHLLTHTSGLGPVRRSTDMLRPMFGWGTQRGHFPASLNDYYRGGLHVPIEPGKRCSYTNIGFPILGQLIEDVSGIPWRDYMRENVFVPLGAGGSGYRLSELPPDASDHLATGYAMRKQGFAPVRYLECATEPASSVFSSVNHMALYARELLRPGRVVKASSLLEMTSVQFRGDERSPGGMGLAFHLDDVGGHRCFWHEGGWPGFSAMMIVAPEAGVATLAFTNTFSARRTSGHVAVAVLREVLGVSEQVEPTVAAPVARELLGAYSPDVPLLRQPARWFFEYGGFKIIADAERMMLRPVAAPNARQLGRTIESGGDSDSLHMTVRHVAGPPLLNVLDGQPTDLYFKRADSGEIAFLCVGSRKIYQKRAY